MPFGSFIMSTASKKGKRLLNKERTKAAILKVALHSFRSKGFDKTTTKEIAKRAGIGEGTLFNYFKTKEELALYFFEQEIEEAMKAYQQDRRIQKAPLAEQLFFVIHKQLEYLGPHEDFLSAILVQSVRPYSKLSPFSLESQQLLLCYLKFIRDILEAAAGRGEIPSLGEMGPHLFWFYYLFVLMYWLNDRSEHKEDSLAFLDRSLKVGVNIIRKIKTQGLWKW